ncbi:MAG: hypothetical protein QG602_1470 [Verrucomicrobiota bacterium]|nr:hypothetical protein [Verrucomicrobiota bacterium]
MINSTSSSDRVLRPEAPVLHAKSPAPAGPGADRFSPENTAALKSALAQQPAVRPEVVARGRELAADPSYPSPEILRKVGEAILRAPDLSEQAD